MFAKEISLDLVKNAGKIIVGNRKYRKLPCSVGTPEEDTLRKVTFADIVDSNGHKIIVLDTYLKINKLQAL